MRGLAGLSVLAVGLELLSRSGAVSPRDLPPATAILGRTAGLAAEPAFLVHVGGTLAAWAAGLLLAIALAVPVGLLVGASRRIRLAATAAIEMLRPIPSVALIPIAILLLGRGLDMRVALVAYAASWPIVINTIAGVRAVDPVALDTARAFGLPRVTILSRVALPSAAPVAFTGVRISAGIGLIVVISAELVAGGGPGIGTWMLSVSQAGVPRELLYAGIVVTGLLGLAVDGALVAGERRLFAWHQRTRSGT